MGKPFFTMEDPTLAYKLSALQEFSREKGMATQSSCYPEW
ncbi:hypothetical protein PF005_g13157 [Phytophthora fragariae]|uniref:Uncharacterized protein n=1 Tax=Phytophthora fragariae TaxID=53985 RepID=A0A6A3KIK2_9STRA|nr:hypothetical protein PF011_g11529 [Phytophthora fragariae]KAE9206063.1 hypothetical protein PF005_g13157 [Phytophthora fragariae]KAE9224805.1 hypothetical protein PF002_g14595 [Phytophthora fragariae]